MLQACKVEAGACGGVLCCCGESAAEFHRALRLHVVQQHVASCRKGVPGLRGHLQQELPGSQPAKCSLQS